MPSHSTSARTIGLLIVPALVGCSQPPAPGSRANQEAMFEPQETQVEVTDLARGNSAFGFDLYRRVAEEEGNLFLSPYSMSIALAMTYAGARGETEREMAGVLHFPLGQDRLHAVFGSLAAALDSRADAVPPEQGDAFTLNVTNALWGQAGYPFLEDFTDVVDRSYTAGLRELDFAGDADGARRIINDDVEEQTSGKIEDLIPPGAIDALTRLVLTSAIYFNASWEEPFNPEATADGPFHLMGGGRVMAPLMTRVGRFRHASGDGYDALALPYVGGHLSMLVLLPAAGRFDEFEDDLDGERLDAIIGDLDGKQVALSMPRFEFTADFSLVEALSALGMAGACSRGADFSGMTGNRELHIGEVIHKAFVSVHEEGTEAAAATAVAMTLTALPAEPLELKVDRPFIFLIRDEPTGSVLFLGRVMDPTAS